ncbi:MAG: hypothetical protein KDD00_12020, partial [Ignavibacteriae bacterium]|nr:hypothetical protein [Ignavibacteriota bacterium]
ISTILRFTFFLLNDQKKEAKKNRPLMINCRKFIRIGGKNFNSPTVRKALTAGSNRKFLLFANTLNFFRQFITGGFKYLSDQK